MHCCQFEVFCLHQSVPKSPCLNHCNMKVSYILACLFLYNHTLQQVEEQLSHYRILVEPLALNEVGNLYSKTLQFSPFCSKYPRVWLNIEFVPNPELTLELVSLIPWSLDTSLKTIRQFSLERTMLPHFLHGYLVSQTWVSFLSFPSLAHLIEV